MADCACDFCCHENDCPYAYDNSDCYVETIAAARAVVDEEFKALCAKITAKNEGLGDDSIDILVRRMKSVIHDSEQVLPEYPGWQTK